MDYNGILLGQRISNMRKRASMSQEALSDAIELSRQHLSLIELGKHIPNADTIVKIANVLHVSADDLLVDSLEYSSSTADTKLHRLLLECNKTEEDIIVRNAENLKALLYFHDVK